MSNTNTGGPAYPTNNWQKMVPQTTGYHEGMTLRDYFAAKAMMGMCFGAPIPNKNELGQIVERSYQVADAMLRAREQ